MCNRTFFRGLCVLGYFLRGKEKPKTKIKLFILVFSYIIKNCSVTYGCLFIFSYIIKN